MNKFYIVGTGPGTDEYLLPVARKAIETSDCLIGASRILSLFQSLDKEKFCMDGNLDKVTPYIKENRYKKRIALLVSGDPGLFSFLGQIQAAFKKEEYVVIPGISSLQLAFARLGEDWQDAKIISLHGRNFGNLAEEVRNSKKVFLFTDKESSPEKVALYLLNEKIENRKAVVFENLVSDNEKVVNTDLKNLSKMKEFGLCVMIILKR